MVNVSSSVEHPWKFDKYKDIEVELKSPNIAIGPDGTRGYWTMVYDEGILVYLGDLQFFHYFEYVVSAKDGEYISRCDRTMVGWYNTDNSKTWGCYFGFKKFTDPPKRPQLLRPLRFMDYKLSFLQQTASSNELRSLESTEATVNEESNYEDLEQYARYLNNQDLTWKAGISDRFRGQTISSLGVLGSRRKLGSQTS